MDNKKKLLEINKSIRRASVLTKEAIRAGDTYEENEIKELLTDVQTLKEMLTERLKKEEGRLAKAD